MPSKLFSKKIWENAVGAAKKPRRLHLVVANGCYYCPVKSCDSFPYHSQRGCRKHVFTKHGWYYYFDEKPNHGAVLPQEVVTNKSIRKTKRSQTSNIPMFLKTCNLYKTFKLWLCSPAGGLKGLAQAEQISCRVLKYLKFCCDDVCPTWEIPLTVVDYCLGTVNMISDFIDNLKTTWKVGFSGIIGYMNSLSHLLDFRRISNTNSGNLNAFVAVEIYINRVKKSLSKKP